MQQLLDLDHVRAKDTLRVKDQVIFRTRGDSRLRSTRCQPDSRGEVIVVRWIQVASRGTIDVLTIAPISPTYHAAIRPIKLFAAIVPLVRVRTKQCTAPLPDLPKQIRVPEWAISRRAVCPNT